MTAAFYVIDTNNFDHYDLFRIKNEGNSSSTNLKLERFDSVYFLTMLHVLVNFLW